MASDSRVPVSAGRPAGASVPVQGPSAARRAMESDSRVPVSAGEPARVTDPAVPHGARAALEADLGQ